MDCPGFSRYFNPPSPCGEGLSTSPFIARGDAFQSTLPVWGGTRRSFLCEGVGNVFQSTLPVWGGTALSFTVPVSRPEFQSTLPVWGGTASLVSGLGGDVFQSTLPVWGGTNNACNAKLSQDISIHPPRVGRDLNVFISGLLASSISIHPPRVGRDLLGAQQGRPNSLFQSTLPVWGGTSIHDAAMFQVQISIHPPRVGRDGRNGKYAQRKDKISIHPPRVGRDWFYQEWIKKAGISIHPPRVGRDLHDDSLSIFDRRISIHPPRVGRDGQGRRYHGRRSNFNPPSPCGEGLHLLISGAAAARFQSTLPVWGGTAVTST